MVFIKLPASITASLKACHRGAVLALCWNLSVKNSFIQPSAVHGAKGISKTSRDAQDVHESRHRLAIGETEYSLAHYFQRKHQNSRRRSVFFVFLLIYGVSVVREVLLMDLGDEKHANRLFRSHWPWCDGRVQLVTENSAQKLQYDL
jgi:hypothetical protein